MPDLELGNLMGLERPLGKLIDGLRTAFGKCYEPTHLVRMAKATRKVELIRVESQIELEQLRERTKARVDAEELIQQQNIEAVVDVAAAQLHGASVSDVAVDADWLARFYRECRNVSDSEVRQVWGRILAGETATPGSFSSRTISTLTLLTRADADAFRKLCSMSFSDRGASYHLYPNEPDVKAVREREDIKYGVLLNLQESGLLTVSDTLGVTFKEPVFTKLARATVLRIEAKPERMVPAYPMTRAGNELARVVEAAPVSAYLDCCIGHLRRYGLGAETST
jgi:hypothetical protein